jgi:hypothetical protein
MIRFTKAHAYGNDFLYVDRGDIKGVALPALAREICERHTGIGADGLIVYGRTAAGATMELFNADGGRAEVSGNGLRALAALLLLDDDREGAAVTITTQAGPKRVTRAGVTDNRPDVPDGDGRAGGHEEDHARRRRRAGRRRRPEFRQPAVHRPWTAAKRRTIQPARRRTSKSIRRFRTRRTWSSRPSKPRDDPHPHLERGVGPTTSLAPDRARRLSRRCSSAARRVTRSSSRPAARSASVARGRVYLIMGRVLGEGSGSRVTALTTAVSARSRSPSSSQ